MLTQKSNKKGAMEMSVGTIVTIVLLMSVLVLGIFLVQEIFSTSSNAIDNVDQQIQSQINELFANQGKDFIVIPQAQPVKIAQGETGSFAFAVRNTGTQEKTYSYEINVREVGCNTLSKDEAMNLIQLGSKASGISVGSGQVMSRQEVRLSVSDDTPLCLIRYNIDFENRNDESVDVEIISSGGLF